MSRTATHLLSDARTRSYGVPDQIPFSCKSMVETLATSIGFLDEEHTPQSKRQAIVDGAGEHANKNGLTFDEVLFLWLRQENLLFAVGRATVTERRES
jgi:hypothetical protein